MHLAAAESPQTVFRGGRKLRRGRLRSFLVGNLISLLSRWLLIQISAHLSMEAQAALVYTLSD